MKKLLFAIALMVSASASAAIVDHGNYFQDTVSGQFWLKLTETTNRSYDDVSSQLGYQQEFEGWRYASVGELEILYANKGIPSQGNSCAVGTYCGDVDPAYEELVEDLIRLFGDTRDIYRDSILDPLDAAPDGTWRAEGVLNGPASTTPTTFVTYSILSDAEVVSRDDGTPRFDDNDRLVTSSGGYSTTYASAEKGAFLVRDTDPTIPLPPPPPPPPPPTDPSVTEATLFDNLAPGVLGLSFDCPYYGVGNPYEEDEGCTWDAEGLYPWYHLIYTGESLTAEYIDMYAFTGGSYEWQLRPWMRVTGYDYSGTLCHPGDIDLGENWCQKVIADAEWTLVPETSAIPGMQSLPTTSLDNIELEFIARNITADYDPWNTANQISPKLTGFITIQIATTSIADGDEFDFNAADVDPATVRAGRGAAPLASAVLTADYDNDGDTDYIFGFRTEDTGVECLDENIMIAGKTYAGVPFHGNDSITTIGCEETVNIDVDPFNAINSIRPNDDYNVTVAVLGSRIAGGDETELRPGYGNGDDVNADSLKFGPAETGNTSTPVITDINGDGLDDMLVSFNAFDAGIACGDTELDMTGEKLSGIPIEGMDNIVTEDCETTGCHP